MVKNKGNFSKWINALISEYLVNSMSYFSKYLESLLYRPKSKEIW